jgi:hypothetical protein
MKAKTIWLLAIVLCFVGAQAQDEFIKKVEPVRSYDGVVQYQKTRQAAKIFEFNYPAKDLGNAIEGYLQQRGGKVRNSKGLNLAKGILLHESEDRLYDVYYKVEGKGKGDKAVSTLSVILAEPAENILLRAQPEAGAAAVTEALPVFAGTGAVGFFSDLGTYVGEYEHGKIVASYEEDYRKAARRYDNLVEEGRSLEKRKQKIEQDISDNINARTKQAREVEKAKLLLEQVKAKKRD